MMEPAAKRFAAVVDLIDQAPTAHKAAEEFIGFVCREIRLRTGEPAGLITFVNLLNQDAKGMGELIGEASWRAAERDRAARMSVVAVRTAADRSMRGPVFDRSADEARGLGWVYEGRRRSRRI